MSSTNPSTFDRKRFREGRLRAGLSQGQLAERLEVSQPTISSWERGRSKPSGKQFELIVRILGDDTSTSEESEQDHAGSPYGGWLTRSRLERGMSRQELASSSGVSEPAIWNIENGKTRNPRPATRTRLEGALGVTPEEGVVSITEQDADVPDVGQLTDFDPHDDADLPDDPGVYVFYDISDRPIYVGESVRISRRVREHADKFWFKRPIVETAGYIRIPDSKLRKQIESTMIRFLKSNAVINRQGVTR